LINKAICSNPCTFFILVIAICSVFNLSAQRTSVELKAFIQNIENAHEVYFSYENSNIEGIQISVPDNLTEMSLEEVLSYLREASPFRAIQTADKLYAIRREDHKGILSGTVFNENNKPVELANIYIEELRKGTVADINGKYNMQIDPGRWTMKISHVSHSDRVVSVDIVPGQTLTKNLRLEGLPYLDELVITGSKSIVGGALASTTLEHGTSIIPIRLQELNKEYYTGVSELLKTEHPAFYSNHQSVADASDHIDPATLRSMGPDQTLVLINGKRRHQSALLNIKNTVGKGSVFTDLNTIPINIIERIEILQDGASSQYGSDAIAGVINIILKENVDYSSFNIKSGITERQDGFFVDLGSNFGFKLNDQGAYFNLSLNHFDRNPTNRSGAYNDTVYGNQNDNNQDAIDDFWDNVTFGDMRLMRFGNSALTNSTAFFSAGSAKTKSVQFYTFGGMTYKTGSSTGVYRLPFQIRGTVEGVPPLGYATPIDTDIIDNSLTLGLKKTTTNGVLDLSNTFGRNSISYKTPDVLETGPTIIANINAGRFVYLQNTTNVDYSHLIGSSFNLNLGAEFRFSKYQQIAGQPQKINETANIDVENLEVFPSITPEQTVDERRINLGLYVDMETDLSENLRLGLSSRYENYNDSGNELTWKLFSRLKLTDKFSIKFSANTGFRAPSLHQIHYTTRSNVFQTGDPDLPNNLTIDHFNRSSTGDNATPILSELQVEPLKSERSLNFNLGFVAEPFSGFTLAGTAYTIDVEDRIIISSQLRADENNSIQDILSSANSNIAQFFTNAIGTNTRGIEMLAKYKWKFNTSGTLDFSLSGHLNEQTVKRTESGDIALENLGSILSPLGAMLFNRSDIGLYENAQPGSRFTFSTLLKTRRVSLLTRFSHYGEIKFIHPTNPAIDENFSPKTVTDASFQYLFGNSLKVTLGVSNIFNVFPDQNQHKENRVGSVNNQGGIFPYNRNVQQFGFSGRLGYINFNVKF